MTNFQNRIFKLNQQLELKRQEYYGALFGEKYEKLGNQILLDIEKKKVKLLHHYHILWQQDPGQAKKLTSDYEQDVLNSFHYWLTGEREFTLEPFEVEATRNRRIRPMYSFKLNPEALGPWNRQYASLIHYFSQANVKSYIDNPSPAIEKNLIDFLDFIKMSDIPDAIQAKNKMCGDLQKAINYTQSELRRAWRKFHWQTFKLHCQLLWARCMNSLGQFLDYLLPGMIIKDLETPKPRVEHPTDLTISIQPFVLGAHKKFEDETQRPRARSNSLPSPLPHAEIETSDAGTQTSPIPNKKKRFEKFRRLSFGR